MAKVLSNLGVKSGYVVFGRDGLDEISASAPTSVCEVRDGFIRSFVIEPEQFGMKCWDKSELVGGTPEENAVITRAVLAGERGARRDAVLLNSAAAIHIGKPEHSLEDAIQIAGEIIDSGKALQQLERFVELSNQ
jgi:anthranilate phosphoribosyltransferase